MVLTRNIGLLLALVLGVAGVSCIPKDKGIQAPTPLDVVVVATVAYPDRPEITGVPDEVAAVILEVVQAHNLQPEVLAEADYAEVFATKRRTLHRVGYLSDHHSSADLLLLVETEPRYFSLLSGRYRWTVDATLSLVPPGHPDEAVTTEVSFPIFMEFHHEQEEEVLAAAAPVLERHLGHLLDEYLAGM
jgi:hypothetical protein